jgi:hypothetical protein
VTDVPEMVGKLAHALVQGLQAQGGILVAPLFDGHEDGLIWQGKLEVLVDGSIDMVALARSALEAMLLPHEVGENDQIIRTKRAWNAAINAALTA